MSEYWVSRKKYFCKYCDIYIADDAPSRNQHESGLRHKGNKDRFVRGLYKQGERHKKDLEEEKREMVRIERAANEAHARDISSGHAAVASGSKPPVSTPSTASTSGKPEKPASPFANYSTAQSLGYTDPDAQRVAAEVERRRAQGVVGEWEVVAAPLASSPPSTDGNESNLADGLARKREADANLDDDDSRRFKMRKKVLSAGLGEIWDPGDIPIKLKSDKVKEEAKREEGEGGWMSRSGGHEVGQTMADPNVDKMIPGPKWTPRGWKRAGVDDGPSTPDDSVPSLQEDTIPTTSNGDPTIKEQSTTASRGSEAAEPVLRDSPEVPRTPKAEPNDDDLSGRTQISSADRGGGSLFRKRKIPASGAAGRGGGTR